MTLRALAMAACVFGSQAAAQAADPSEPPCVAAPYRAFDFWLGTWNVYQADGEFAGRNVITLESEGCVLHESWRSVAGNDGVSINFVDPSDGSWRQVWASPGLHIDYAGAAVREGQIVMVGTATYAQSDGSASYPFRGVWTAREDGRVVQHFQQQSEDGEWTDWFLATYVSAKQDPNGVEPPKGSMGPVLDAPPEFALP